MVNQEVKRAKPEPTAKQSWVTIPHTTSETISPNNGIQTKSAIPVTDVDYDEISPSLPK